MKKLKIFLLTLIVLVVVLSACIDSGSYAPSQENNSTQNSAGGAVEGTIPDSADNDFEEQESSQDEAQGTMQDEVWESTHYVQALVNVNVRTQPSSSENNILTTLRLGERVTLIEQHNQNWYYIIYNNQKAYISANSNYTRLIAIGEQAQISQREADIESIISAGMSRLGVPYEYGAPRILLYGGAPNPTFTGKTFDCSSFVQYSFYIGANIKLQGDSRSQSVHGQSIQRSNLERGDIIFMTTPARVNIKGIEHIGHVAIYLGEGKILHTYGAGGVRVDNLAGVWSNRYVSAKRMF